MSEYYQYVSDSDEDEMDNSEEQRREALLKKQKIKDEELVIGIIVNSLKAVFNRYRQEDDPVLRYTMFLDKFQLFLDIILGTTKTLVNRYDPLLQQHIDEIVTNMRKDFLDLNKWIKSPQYSPDHPYGNKLMKEAQLDFVQDDL